MMYGYIEYPTRIIVYIKGSSWIFLALSHKIAHKVKKPEVMAKNAIDMDKSISVPKLMHHCDLG